MFCPCQFYDWQGGMSSERNASPCEQLQKLNVCACYHWWIGFLVWLLSSFFFVFSFFKLLSIFNNNFLIFYFNNFILFFLSFFLSPLFSCEPCGWQGCGALAGCQAWASEVGEPSSGLSGSTRDLPAPHNIKQWKVSQRYPSLNTKTQLHSMTSKLQCWAPHAKQLARQEHNLTH